MSSAVVLVPLGVDGQRYAEDLGCLAQATGASLAYLHLGSPTLTDGLDRLARCGVTSVNLVGLALGAPTARSWLRRVAGHWRRTHPEVEVVIAGKPVTGAEAPLVSPEWERATSHRNHVLVCRGPRCAARGSAATARALSTALREHGLTDDDVLLTQTGCLFPCNHAPVVVVHPQDIWFGGVGADVAAWLVAHHLTVVHDEPVVPMPRQPIGGPSAARAIVHPHSVDASAPPAGPPAP